MIVHDYGSQNKRANDYTRSEWYKALIAKAFPGAIKFTIHRSIEKQLSGIDVTVSVAGGDVTLDNKFRERVYSDYALEYISNDVSSSPGWICKLLSCDLISYCFVPNREMHLIPTKKLQELWSDMSRDWLERYGIKRSQNRGYATHWCAVPILVVKMDIPEIRVISLSDEYASFSDAYAAVRERVAGGGLGWSPK